MCLVLETAISSDAWRATLAQLKRVATRSLLKLKLLVTMVDYRFTAGFPVRNRHGSKLNPVVVFQSSLPSSNAGVIRLACYLIFFFFLFRFYSLTAPLPPPPRKKREGVGGGERVEGR